VVTDDKAAGLFLDGPRRRDQNGIYRYTLPRHVRLDVRLGAIFCKTVELFAKLNAPRQLKPTLLNWRKS
jgi:hypothetical protein